MHYYVYDLESGIPVMEPNQEKAWAFLDAHKIVEQTDLASCWISTVFLSWDHQYGSGPPLVFETMVFSSSKNLHEIDACRYTTLEEAVAGHKRFVKKYTSDLEVLAKAHSKPKEGKA